MPVIQKGIYNIPHCLPVRFNFLKFVLDYSYYAGERYSVCLDTYCLSKQYKHESTVGGKIVSLEAENTYTLDVCISGGNMDSSSHDES